MSEVGEAWDYDKVLVGRRLLRDIVSFIDDSRCLVSDHCSVNYAQAKEFTVNRVPCTKVCKLMSETVHFCASVTNAQLASQLREAISDYGTMSAIIQKSNQKYKRSQQENALKISNSRTWSDRLMHC